MISQEISLLPADNGRLSNFCGQLNTHLRQIEARLQVEIANRGNQFKVTGLDTSVKAACAVMQKLFASTEKEQLTAELIHLAMQDASIDEMINTSATVAEQNIAIKTKAGMIKGRGPNQQAYLRKITSHDINFGVGPAGTGKTYLAVACAIDALQNEKVRKIILVRPAVEAGEKLGFLPGDMAQKVDPYLRPLYDALYEMLGFERVEKMIDKGIIEVAPLAFMRGRTLNDAFIILDEAQNTTTEQIKMFLTRVGFGSTAVVTGDITQTDLPSEKMSGLRHVLEVLKDIEGISFTFFGTRDVVRHPLVQRIVSAYEAYEQKNNPEP
ncbi:MAG: PhoH family protein [Methylococcaceae bacterium]|jgi:phosphate starvation-inducible PhoH-like protein|nr:PhoH family protein [Methylococcaceae bacterium]MDD1636675.1 PhoH family protein [Methylococcaceae bacterium]MDD1643318.1 PhoH family protein [Methylococcaceae bacterium]OYV20399.1 MAG: phosphate starvation-inducible protein PhoH [Methylococcaceae bacterium NSM2-1]